MIEPLGLPIYEEEPVSQITIEHCALNIGQWVSCGHTGAIGPVVGSDINRDAYAECFLIIPCSPGYGGGGPEQEWRIRPVDISMPAVCDFHRNSGERRKLVIDGFHVGDRCLHTRTEDIVTVLDPGLHGTPIVSPIRTMIQIRTSEGDIQSTSTGRLVNITSTGFGGAKLVYGQSIEPVTATGQRLFWND